MLFQVPFPFQLVFLLLVAVVNLGLGFAAAVYLGWAPRNWGDESPWQRMFRNARRWVG